ncbi:UTP--glucose-1-phosphate uridylyltransferase [Shewanella hanedai]|uniref:UTP--glucose-1-phosphate uridylyltransferase n=1 Tax=Shewanella hanedai TaxID=25 RepID=A0A553JMI5_SHEHA|nr:UTP--glucose-1-phosphate uridylyltransferase [Shewanella hanedai]TRY13678.1 UTP--glucose-1-phosphate uridylyltransferase [Shewanella hanedai]GGI98591.1 UTP--glucose-1-phosphate uridylyltransferase [Shewanella hanedai]
MTRKVTKAVFPVAGLGTRMLPATKAIPKEMLPIVDKPLIQYVVNEAVAAGIKEIILVTHSSKNAIENHFDTSFELEATLEARVKRSLLSEIRAIIPKGVTVISLRQSAPLGLGHAILTARSIVGEQPFAVLLPDVIIDKYLSNHSSDNLAEMINRFEHTGHSQIMVESIPHEKVNQYGVVDVSSNVDLEVELDAERDAGLDAGFNAIANKKQRTMLPGQSAVICDMVEKPELDQAPSNLAITGRYVLSEKIWDLLQITTPGAGDEIQLTDALHKLREIETIEAYHIKGKSHDCGSKLGYMMANVEYGMKCGKLGEEFKAALHSHLAIEDAKQSTEQDSQQEVARAEF